MKSGFEYPPPHLPVPRLGGRAPAGSSTSTALSTAGYDASGNNLSADRRPVRVVPARTGAGRRVRPSPSSRRSTRRTPAAWVNDEFKVSDKLTLTLGLRFDYQFGAHRERRPVLDVRSRTRRTPAPAASPARSSSPGDGPGRSGTRQVRRPDEGCVGSASRASPIGSATRTRFAAATASTTRGVAFDQFVGQPTTRLRGEPARAEPTATACIPAFYLDQGFPAGSRRAAAVHRSGLRQRRRRRSPWRPTG